jgi:hypothetical protein
VQQTEPVHALCAISLFWAAGDKRHEHSSENPWQWTSEQSHVVALTDGYPGSAQHHTGELGASDGGEHATAFVP